MIEVVRTYNKQQKCMIGCADQLEILFKFLSLKFMHFTVNEHFMHVTAWADLIIHHRHSRLSPVSDAINETTHNNFIHRRPIDINNKANLKAIPSKIGTSLFSFFSISQAPTSLMLCSSIFAFSRMHVLVDGLYSFQDFPLEFNPRYFFEVSLPFSTKSRPLSNSQTTFTSQIPSPRQCF